MPATVRERLLGHLVGLLTLTLPVTLYFALFEGSAQQATPGKRALGLRGHGHDRRAVRGAAFWRAV